MNTLNWMKLSLFAMAFTGLVACSSNGDENTDQSEGDPQTTEQETTTAEADVIYEGDLTQEQTNQLVEAYLETKDALVNDDAEGAKAGANNLLAVLQDVSMDETLESIQLNAQAISEADKIDVQRERFYTISESIYKISKAKPSDVTLYKQFCPMAFENEGAYWISQKEEIYNPYFGSSMLKCGKVEETIAAN